MQRSFAILAAGLLLAGWCSSSASRATAADPGLISALPEKSLLVVRADSISRLRERFEASPLFKLKDRPEFAPLFEQIQSAYEKARQEGKKEAGVDLGEILGALQGEATFAVGDIMPLASTLSQALGQMEEPKVDPESIPVIVSVDTLSKKAQAKRNVDAIVAFARREGVRVDEEEFQGARIIVFNRPEHEKAGPEHIYLAERGSLYALTLSRGFLNEILTRLASGEKAGTLVENPIFQSIRRATGAEGELFGYVNLQALTQSLDRALGTSMFAFFWMKGKALLFGESLNAAGFSLALEPGGVREKVLVHNAGAEDGLVGWLKAPPFPPRPVSVVPGEAKTFSSLGINVTRVFSAIREIVQTVMAFQGQTTDLNTLFEQQFGVSLDALTRSLGKRLDMFYITGPTEANPAGDMSLILALEDEKPVAQLIDRISMMSGGEFAPRQYLERKLYSTQTSVPGLSPSLCVSDRMLIFSMAGENVEKVIGRIGKEDPGAGGNPEFKRMSKSFPSQVLAVSYADAEYFVSLIDNLTQAMRMAAGPGVPTGFFDLLKAGVKGFGSSASYSVWKEGQGIYSEGWLPYAK